MVRFFVLALALTLALPVTILHATFDDNFGTNTPLPSGLPDGDTTGVVNARWHWSILADTSTSFNFTVWNTWMGNSPTVFPTTTLSADITASYTGAVSLTDATGFQAISSGNNAYAIIDGNEMVALAGNGTSGYTISSRGSGGTTAAAHLAGASFMQVITQATGPNNGPFNTGTADFTPRRTVNFHPTTGTLVQCTITPFGGSPVTQNITVDSDQLWTLVGNTINKDGATSFACHT